jgi:hypothetical protein
MRPPLLLLPLFLLLTVAPVRAELREVAFHFQPTDCASCTQSLPERFQRVRGVESVKLDVEASVLRLFLAAENRVRLSRLREALQQDGTKLLKSVITGAGECARDAEGGWTFRPLPADSAYPLEAPAGVAAGACQLKDATVR